MKLKLPHQGAGTFDGMTQPPDAFDETIVPINLVSVDFRHLNAFKNVYQEKNYANAGINLSTTRKSIRRMMVNLERIFECILFTEGEKGELYPTAFSERLHNDLRFLNSAQYRLMEHINGIHETGRVLHIGSSPAVFRTLVFRSLFKELQSLKGIRISYTATDAESAGKSLIAGHCDLYIGPWAGHPKRYATVDAGNVSYNIFTRSTENRLWSKPQKKNKAAYVVQLDGVKPNAYKLPDCGMSWNSLSEKQWMRWLSYPEECPEETILYAPEVPVDPTYWSKGETPSSDHSTVLPLQASFLRHHPYEFLPALASRVRQHAMQS